MRKIQPQAKEPVKIRFKELADGSKSIYLDIYRNGKRSYQFLKLYIVPEKTSFDKANNANALQAANVIKADLIRQIANGEADIKIESNVLLSEYWQKCVNKKNCAGNTSLSYRSALKSILRYKGDVKLKDIDKDYITGLLSFLCNNLKGTTATLYASKLSNILSHAERENLIRKNYFKVLDTAERINVRATEREYLTIEEVKSLTRTPINTKFDTKAAFMFSCFTGLRWSDIEKLTWGEITTDERGAIRINGVTQKTKTQFSNALPSGAIKYLPERKGKADFENVFNLQTHVTINKLLKEWAQDAGIKKNISFHTARHTFATMLLTQGADLYTVSKLLGHAEVSTTQIYAKIIDKKKDEAMMLLNNIM